MKDLKGATALVTGAAGGLGRHIARALHGEGVRLVLSGRNQGALEELRHELGGGTAVVTADLADPEEAKTLIERVEREAAPVDILVNNAGIELTQPFGQISDDELVMMSNLNFVAPMLLTRHALGGMAERGRGHVVQISSLAAKIAPAWTAPYAATKIALIGLTHALRNEHRGSPVGFSVVCPGFMADDGMFARYEHAVKLSPLARAAPARKVGPAVVKAIRRDLPEVLVSGAPVRPALVLGEISPSLGEQMAELSGANGVMKKLAAADGRV